MYEIRNAHAHAVSHTESGDVVERAVTETESDSGDMAMKVVFLLTVLVCGVASQCKTPWEDCGKPPTQ